MHLKSLTLNGFKSFAQKTQFEFHEGVTGIVGPNGCGKSNVVDAIRWVLGETSAKALRGGEMADVIFNGTDSRKAVGMAEVTLTLADCEETLGVEFNELAITRRVYRDGKSDYRINGKGCRLKDINSLLMDTGIGRTAYSIMEQGKIDQLLSSKPEDRRAVFEEAAGITKFKSQKKEALRKLEYTEANLLRVEDIVAEVTRQMSTLQRQASKARRYKEIDEHVRVLDAHYSHRKFRGLAAEAGELDTSIDSLGKEREELGRTIVKSEQNVSESRSALSSLENRIGERRTEIQEIEKQIHSAKSRIELNTERISEFHELAQGGGTEVTDMANAFTQHEQELFSADAALQQAVDTIGQRRNQLSETESKHGEISSQLADAERRLKERREEIRQADERRVSLQAKLETNQASLLSDNKRASQIAAELGKMESEQARLNSVHSRIQQDLSGARQDLQQRETAQKEATARLEANREAHRDIETKQRGVQSDLALQQGRLEVLQELSASGEGLEEGTRAVLNGLEVEGFRAEDISGQLGSLIRVETGCLSAIEAALGDHLETLLVSDSELAETIVHALANKSLGRASLMPRNLLPEGDAGQMMTIPTGGIAWAIDRVNGDGVVQEMLEVVLANVLIVPDLNAALELHPDLPGVSFAGMDGGYLGATGVIRGGTAGGDAGSVLGREQEIRDLAKSTSELKAKTSELEEAYEASATKLREDEEGAEQARKAFSEARLAQSTLEANLGLADREVRQTTAKIDTSRLEATELRGRNDNVQKLIAEMDDEQSRKGQELEQAREGVTGLEQAVADLADRAATSSEHLGSLRTSLAVEERAEQALKEQRNPIANRMVELQELMGRRKAEAEAYAVKAQDAKIENDRLQSSMGDMNKNVEGLAEAFATMRKEREDHTANVRKEESVLTEGRQKLSAIGEQLSREEVRRTKIELREETLLDHTRERYNIDLQTFRPDAHALILCIDEQKKASRRWKTKPPGFEQFESEQTEVTPPPTAEITEQSNEEEVDDEVSETSEELQVEDSDASQETSGAEVTARESADNAAPEEAASEEEMALFLEDGPDWNFVELAVKELRRRLESMGSVNLDAIDEFAELEERHTFLQEQVDDLNQSKEELRTVISKINRTTRTMFQETFDQVRTNFRETFKELFGKGAKADLILIEDDDPLESGIEIVAKPPGKKLQSITLLSGGERSMTAVALLFSIYMVKPSPFCVLDELDAPLDESNIGRFLKNLDRFIDHSQFVIVTHNKRTMHRADVMYGITMEEFGISKAVGMKFSGREKDTDSEATAALESKRKGRPDDQEAQKDAEVPADAEPAVENAE